MSEDDDLRINTLHRFAKHSPRLVLQEYSHCEVPAGCGGVVLRWTDPAHGVPVSISLVALHATSETWLDGERLASSRVTLAAGWHVLAFHVSRRDARAAPFTLGAVMDADDERDLIHTGTPRWRMTAQRPPEGWHATGFDELGWVELEAASADITAPFERYERYALDLAATRGQPIYAVAAAELWGRVTFAIPEAP